ncbi:hypothetical protein [Bacillus sp. OK048]|uniref:hypothetical protein n=1 Tax=Bacillus sp. OK048 TaxID=1882761 RepID=UPI000886896E|nr:hypothetical protein [Bacillus sp. OK048]SDM62580.1 hypothetical protein SAMN05443253_104305 [Bacillus sp. OK048]
MAENVKDHKPNGENDRFTRLMFRNSKQGDLLDENDDHSQVRSEQKNNSNFVRKSYGFDDWLLGNRRKVPEKKSHTTVNQIENTLQKVDLELLMETIDMFATTSKQFKPIIKEISPFFNRFFKKLKSNAD